MGEADPPMRRRWFERHGILAAIFLPVVAAWAVFLWVGLHQPGAKPAGRWAESLAVVDAEIARLAPALAAAETRLSGDVCVLDRPPGGWPPVAPPVPSGDAVTEAVRGASVLVLFVDAEVSQPWVREVATGFFVAPDAVITDGAKFDSVAGRSEIYVTSPALGRLIRVASPQPLPPVAPEIRLALLRLSVPAPNALVLPIGPPLSPGRYKAPSYAIEIPRRVDLAAWRGGVRPANMPGERIVDASVVFGDGRLRTRAAGSIHDHGAPLVDACGRIVGALVSGRESIGLARVVSSRELFISLAAAGLARRIDGEPCRAETPAPR